MDKRLACFISLYRDLDLSEEGRSVPADPQPDFEDSPLKAILDEIFSVDPDSGLPKGDIQYYLSKDGNPTVKQWLENNLLLPGRSSGSKNPDVTDDMIVEFSRGKDESVSDYTSRLKNLYDSALSEYQKSLNPNPPANE